MKICNTCKKEYPATEEYFYKQSGGREDLRSDCKKCHNEMNIQRAKENRLGIRNKIAAERKEKEWQKLLEEGKQCNVCGEKFPPTPKYFHRNKNYKFGIGSTCKECVSKTDKERYQRKKLNPPKPKVQASLSKKEKEGYLRLINEPRDYGIGDKLKNVVVEEGKIYEIEMAKDLRKTSFEKVFEGKLVSETDNLIVLKHKFGYCESFRKYDILSNEYKIKEVAK